MRRKESETGYQRAWVTRPSQRLSQRPSQPRLELWNWAHLNEASKSSFTLSRTNCWMRGRATGGVNHCNHEVLRCSLWTSCSELLCRTLYQKEFPQNQRRMCPKWMTKKYLIWEISMLKGLFVMFIIFTYSAIISFELWCADKIFYKMPWRWSKSRERCTRPWSWHRPSVQQQCVPPTLIKTITW